MVLVDIFRDTWYAICNVREGTLKKEYELWKSVRDFWKTGKTGFVLFLISLFGIIYSYVALNCQVPATEVGACRVPPNKPVVATDFSFQ